MIERKFLAATFRTTMGKKDVKAKAKVAEPSKPSKPSKKEAKVAVSLVRIFWSFWNSHFLENSLQSQGQACEGSG